MVRPVVTPQRMAQIDRAAPEPMEVLIDRAGLAVAQTAKRMLRAGRGSVPGARVVVLAGKGNNGADGRVAARFLQDAGARCAVVDAAASTAASLVDGAPSTVDAAVASTEPPPGARSGPRAWRTPDLLIDAAYGTGFRGEFISPIPPSDISCPVLAVDIPSGVDGLTGAANGTVIPADRTVTFVAVKPGLLLEPGRWLAGELEVVDIGLEPSGASAGWVSRHDLGRWPQPNPTAHKWQRAVRLVGGSPPMTGAPALAAAAALRAGAGYVTLSIPGSDPATVSVPAGTGPPASAAAPAAVGQSGVAGAMPVEVVHAPLAASGWEHMVLADLDRYGALVIGPGLTPTPANRAAVQAVLGSAGRCPVVADAGAIDAIVGPSTNGARPLVLTPHAGELRRLAQRCGWSDLDSHPDPVERVELFAQRLGCVVLAKGPTTIVADANGRTMLVTDGDQRLATAGTGDVLAGIIGAGMAGGLDPFHAAGLGAELHAQAAARGYRRGLIASDLPSLVAEYLSDIGPTPMAVTGGDPTDIGGAETGTSPGAIYHG